MDKRTSLQIIAAAIGLLTAMALFNLLKKWDARSSHQLKQIGEILSIDGAVERRSPGALTMEAVPGPRPLYHQDLLVTQRGGFATIVLSPDGPTLKINEGSRFIAEIDAARPQAFIGTILDGTVSVVNPGQKGVFRLYREGREISFESADRTMVPVIPMDKSVATGSNATTPPAPTTGATPGIVITATQVDESARASKLSHQPSADAAPAAQPPSGSDTDSLSDILTNDDIMKTVRSQTSYFQRCFLSYIHRAGASATAQGTIVLSFTIQPSGKVSEAQLVRSEFNDLTLHNCTREVIERTRFKLFKGPAVPVQEFPVLLQ
jgi:Gram-negative bacterial TonB protein C-terminal